MHRAYKRALNVIHASSSASSTSSGKEIESLSESSGHDAHSQTAKNTMLNSKMSEQGQQLNQFIVELDSVDNFSGSSCGISLDRSGSTITNEERMFLLAVERGDAATVKEFLRLSGAIPIANLISGVESDEKVTLTPQPVDGEAQAQNFDINCVDALGRNAVLISIENEHIEILELLLTHNVEMSDALLHAINEENLEAVEIILQAQNERQEAGLSPLGSCSPSSTSFTSDITPIILAAHRDNHSIIKLLLDRGDRIPKPHDLRCTCDVCNEAQVKDSLCHSKSRINAYKALASPSLICLSSKDPLLTAFELSWELKRLGFLENEFISEYERLSKQCQDFAKDLLEQTRSSEELAIVLNHSSGSGNERGAADHSLARLKLAIKYKQKLFVAHPHCQQLLASLWYEGLPGFRRKPFLYKTVMIGSLGLLFPILSILYLVAPKSRLGGIMRKPFIKFLCHSASYLVFLLLLILAALRIEYIGETQEREIRDSPPSTVECAIIVYIAGFIWAEIKQLWVDGIKSYISDMWNLLDFVTNSLYISTISLRVVAYVKFQSSPQSSLRRNWDSYDPILISECLFAAANIFSTLKLVYIFTVNPHLGPLQISLGRMLNDILKFFCVYMLVLIAFACGLNQLLWFYSNERKKTCQGVSGLSFKPKGENPDSDLYTYCVSRGRYFTNLFEIVQSLYWSTYGLIDLSNLNLEYPHQVTEFIGKLMFGTYSYIALIVLLNMLIAMMNNTYQIIAQQADTEWKFARSKLWISFFEDGGTLPVPFNMIPSPKSISYLITWFKEHCVCKRKNKKSRWQSIKKIVTRVNEMEHKYQRVMTDLIKRYLMHRQQTDDNQGVTEDDLNEIKGDISSFRFELLEILKMNGMKTPEHIEKSTTKLRGRGAKRALNNLSRRFDNSDDTNRFGKSGNGNTFFNLVNNISDHNKLNISKIKPAAASNPAMTWLNKFKARQSNQEKEIEKTNPNFVDTCSGSNPESEEVLMNVTNLNTKSSIEEKLESISDSLTDSTNKLNSNLKRVSFNWESNRPQTSTDSNYPPVFYLDDCSDKDRGTPGATTKVSPSANHRSPSDPVILISGSDTVCMNTSVTSPLIMDTSSPSPISSSAIKSPFSLIFGSPVSSIVVNSEPTTGITKTQALPFKKTSVKQNRGIGATILGPAFPKKDSTKRSDFV